MQLLDFQFFVPWRQGQFAFRECVEQNRIRKLAFPLQIQIRSIEEKNCLQRFVKRIWSTFPLNFKNEIIWLYAMSMCLKNTRWLMWKYDFCFVLKLQILKIQLHKRFKRRPNTTSNVRGHPLYQAAKRHLTVKRWKMMKN